jgi:hypothetical protein
MKRSLLVVALAVTGVFAGAPEALADDVECIGTLSGPIHGNVVVPSGVECILEGAEVFGNALAQPESMLFMEESGVHGSVEVKALAHTGALGSSIDGNYKCDDCFFEDVIESEVGGSVQTTGADDGTSSRPASSTATSRSSGALPEPSPSSSRTAPSAET